MSNSSISKGIVYYTDNRCSPRVLQLAQDYLTLADLPIVSVSLKPLSFGRNIYVPWQRGYLTMFKQILIGLESINTDIVFLAEHDVFYHKSHFDFTPIREDQFYYNLNNWQVRFSDGFAVYWDCKKVSQICVYRNLALKHYRERVRKIEKNGFTYKMGFEPGAHNRNERVDDLKSDVWQSGFPNLDVKHGLNLTKIIWDADGFNRPCKNWHSTFVNQLPGWEDLNLC